MKATLRKTGTCVAVITMLAMLFPLATPTVHAGNDEWATAGKILTGVVIGKVLTDHWDRGRGRDVTVKETTTVIRHENRNRNDHRRRGHRSWKRSGSHGRDHGRHDRLGHGRRHGPPPHAECPRHAHSRCRHYSRERVVVEVTRHRRIVRNRRYGHGTYMHRRSRVSYPEVTVCESRSIY